MFATQTHTQKWHYSHVNYCDNSFCLVTNPSTSAVYCNLNSVENGDCVKKNKQTVHYNGQKVAETDGYALHKQIDYKFN